MRKTKIMLLLTMILMVALTSSVAVCYAEETPTPIEGSPHVEPPPIVEEVPIEPPVEEEPTETEKWLAYLKEEILPSLLTFLALVGVNLPLILPQLKNMKDIIIGWKQAISDLKRAKDEHEKETIDVLKLKRDVAEMSGAVVKLTRIMSVMAENSEELVANGTARRIVEIIEGKEDGGEQAEQPTTEETTQQE